MKSINYISNLLWCCIILCLSGCNQQEEEKKIVFSSPDSDIQFKVDLVNNQLTYSVLFKDQPVIEGSPMVMTVDIMHVQKMEL